MSAKLSIKFPNQLSMTNDSWFIEKGWSSTFELYQTLMSCKLLLIELEDFLKHGFQLSMTEGSRVVEKGHGSTFEVCHALVSCKTTNEITKTF